MGRSRSRDRQLSGNFKRNDRVVLSHDQVPKQVPIETEIDTSSVGNIIISLRIVQILQ